jgi:hypothetical protein
MDAYRILRHNDLYVIIVAMRLSSAPASPDSAITFDLVFHHNQNNNPDERR